MARSYGFVEVPRAGITEWHMFIGWLLRIAGYRGVAAGHLLISTELRKSGITEWYMVTS